MLQRAAEKTHSSGAKPQQKPAAKALSAEARRDDGRYQSALSLAVNHYCGKGKSFCKTAKALQASYKSALAKNDIAAFKRMLSTDVKRSCAGNGSSTDRCKALTMLHKAAAQLRTHPLGR